MVKDIFKKANLGKPNFALAPQAPVDPAEQQCENEYNALLQYLTSMMQPPPADNTYYSDCIRFMIQTHVQHQSYCQTMNIIKEQRKCYFDLGINKKPIWWYHPDHLGSSSYLTDFSGIPSHYYDYLPFGEEMVSQNTSVYNNFYKFSGKELDEDTGLYYFGARYYDPKWSVWLSVDAMAEKSPNAGPYNYCMGNPVNLVDPDGRDIIILSHGHREKTSVDGGKTNGHRHFVGHMAVLIGNEKTGWTYLSYDYDKGTNKGRGKSGKNDVYTETKFKTLDDFKNSEHNTFKDDYDDGKGLNTSHRDKNGKIIQRFENAYQITTNVKTDALMLNAAEKVFDEPWSEVSSFGQANQCTTVAEKALNAGGLKNGENQPTGRYNNQTGEEILENNYLPAAKQKAIEMKNKGKDVDNKIKRTN